MTNYWLRWMALMREHGVVSGYQIAGSDYVPGSFLVLRGVNVVASLTGIHVLFVLKGALLLSAALSAVLLWCWHRDAWCVAGMSWALLLSSVADAYLDVLYLPPLLLTMRWLQQGRLGAAAAAFVVALSIKWQPLIVAPVLLIYVLSPAGRAKEPHLNAWPVLRRLALGALPFTLLLVAAFGATPILISLKRALSHRALSFQGLNLGWILQLGLEKFAAYVDSPALLSPPPTAALVALSSLFAVSYLVVCVFLWRKGRDFSDLVWCATVAALLYFAFNRGVHENHLFLAMALAFVLFPAKSPAARVLAWTTAIASNLNLLIFYGIGSRAPLRIPFFEPMALVLALLNTTIAVLCLREMLRRWSAVPSTS